MRKWKKGCVLVVAVVVLGFVLHGLYMRYLFVTNPDDPGFDPKQFRFSHYNHIKGNEHEVKAALLKMFPPGTDKSYVDEILVEKADAKAKRNQLLPNYHKPTDQDYSYKWSPSGLGGWVVRFIFDENNKSIMMKMGKRPLYGIDPKDKFWEEKGHERQ